MVPDTINFKLRYYILHISRSITNKSFRIKTNLSIRLLLREGAPQATNLVFPGICNLYLFFLFWGSFDFCLFSFLYAQENMRTLRFLSWICSLTCQIKLFILSSPTDASALPFPLLYFTIRSPCLWKFWPIKCHSTLF